MKISEAILLFLESFDIEEDNYCFDAAKQAYYRILNSIVEMNDRSKTDGDTVIIKGVFQYGAGQAGQHPRLHGIRSYF